MMIIIAYKLMFIVFLVDVFNCCCFIFLIMILCTGSAEFQDEDSNCLLAWLDIILPNANLCNAPGPLWAKQAVLVTDKPRHVTAKFAASTGEVSIVVDNTHAQ
eukprot:m.109628 g.109628  ORF g.109628 m.109628 type:complete len:103 (-) comp15246_c0_seq20:66-374(-)